MIGELSEVRLAGTGEVGYVDEMMPNGKAVVELEPIYASSGPLEARTVAVSDLIELEEVGSPACLVVERTFDTMILDYSDSPFSLDGLRLLVQRDEGKVLVREHRDGIVDGDSLEVACCDVELTDDLAREVIDGLQRMRSASWPDFSGMPWEPLSQSWDLCVYAGSRWYSRHSTEPLPAALGRIVALVEWHRREAEGAQMAVGS